MWHVFLFVADRYFLIIIGFRATTPIIIIFSGAQPEIVDRGNSCGIYLQISIAIAYIYSLSSSTSRFQFCEEELNHNLTCSLFPTTKRWKNFFFCHKQRRKIYFLFFARSSSGNLILNPTLHICITTERTEKDICSYSASVPRFNLWQTLKVFTLYTPPSTPVWLCTTDLCPSSLICDTKIVAFTRKFLTLCHASPEFSGIF